MHDVPVDFKDKFVVGLAPQDWEQGFFYFIFFKTGLVLAKPTEELIELCGY